MHNPVQTSYDSSGILTVICVPVLIPSLWAARLRRDQRRKIRTRKSSMFAIFPVRLYEPKFESLILQFYSTQNTSKTSRFEPKGRGYCHLGTLLVGTLLERIPTFSVDSLLRIWSQSAFFKYYILSKNHLSHGNIS